MNLLSVVFILFVGLFSIKHKELRSTPVEAPAAPTAPAAPRTEPSSLLESSIDQSNVRAKSEVAIAKEE
jgi:hypothetical protein